MEYTKGSLEGKEVLWDVALRSIGIFLSDEYVLRFTKLMNLASQKGLGNIKLDDTTDIEFEAREEIKARHKKKLEHESHKSDE